MGTHRVRWRRQLLPDWYPHVVLRCQGKYQVWGFQLFYLLSLSLGPSTSPPPDNYYKNMEYDTSVFSEGVNILDDHGEGKASVPLR